MKLKLTLQRSSGPDADIVVTTDAAATVGEVAGAIVAVDPFRAKLAREGDEVSGPARLRIIRPPGQGDTLLEPESPLAEAAIGSGSTISIVPAGIEIPRLTTTPVAVLRVVSGPDAGSTFPLPLGIRYLGRDVSVSDVTLNDPLVSKRHARIDVFAQSIRLVDLNSANGLEVDGGLVTRIDLENGATVRVGDSVLQAVIQAPVRASTHHDSGPVSFNRSPRVETRYPGKEYAGPKPPGDRDPTPFPWLALAIPILMAVVFVFVIGRGPEAIIFVAAAPLLMIGTWLTSRAQRKRKEKLQIQQFTERAAYLDSTLAAEVEVERRIRKQESPTTAETMAAASERGSLLWTRRPEHWQFLSLHLGMGVMRSRNSVTVAEDDAAQPVFLQRAEAIRDRYCMITDVPVTENLFFSGALGIAGTRVAAADVARSAIVQLTGLHSPAEVVVAAVLSNAWTPEFEWLKWLPHTASPHSPISAVHLANSQATGDSLLSAIEELVTGRTTKASERGAALLEFSALVAGASAGDGAEVATPPPSATPAILLLISDDAPVDRARLVQLAESAANAGVYPIWISASQAELPAVARTFVDVGSDGRTATVGLVRLGTDVTDVVTEPVTRDQALNFARSLSSVVDGGALLRDASDIPRTVSLLSLLGLDIATDPAVAVGRWRENDSIHDRSGRPVTARRAGKLRALVGQSGVDAMHLDLRTQGPHALVGGTTGSGKSEFLQAWVLGMAAEYSPDRVTFLFVDYKGGSAFADCVALPHCVGLVTDLSPHLVRRALTSLHAELHYRERLFNRKKAKDLLDLEKRGDPESPPALVLVIDEFAALASEVPEFVDGVVDIAQRGRSLGIHLIMATQRPAGVIRDNLRANTNLRIALRMADDSDSVDVVGDKIAGTFDPSLPGRAIAKTGPGRLTSFQSAYAGGWTSDTPTGTTVEVAELRFGAEHIWEAPNQKIELPGAGEQGPTDQTRLVTNLTAAAVSIGIPPPRRPWLDELAQAFDLTKLRQRTDTELVLGVSDLPRHQRQEEAYFRPDVEGNIVIYGAGGTGKTVTLRSIAAAAGITPRGGPIDVYGLDFGTGGLRMLETLPHVGSIVSGDDPERVIRLLRILKSLLDDRGQRYAAVNAGNIVDYRRNAQAPHERRILLLIDNFPSFRTEFEVGASRAPWYSCFQQLLSEGRGLGMHVAMTADRPGSVPTAVSSAFQRRVVHRLADDSQYMLLDMPSDVLSPTSPAGRAVIDGVETQIAIVGGKSNVADQSKALIALAEAMSRNGRTSTEPVGTLATEFGPETLPASIAGMPVLGLSDDTLAPMPFDPVGTFVLAGPPASGRSNALLWLIRSLDSALPQITRFYFGHARSSISTIAGWEATARTVEDATGLAKELIATMADPDQKGKIVVVIEQIGDFLSSAADSSLVELIKAVKRSDHFLIADSESSGWGSSWPLLAEVKSGRTGLLLQPETIEGDTILKTSLPRITRSDFPPGRGYFIARGKTSRVQLPLVRQ
ncbi:MAG: FtsK/SpoIIIE domain-containing protein [Rhodoglobus sp.]